MVYPDGYLKGTKIPLFTPANIAAVDAASKVCDTKEEKE
jgi:hypothetical protein